MESPSVLLAGMEGSSLGVWVAHGEGRAHFPDATSRKSAVEGGLAPVRQVCFVLFVRMSMGIMRYFLTFCAIIHVFRVRIYILVYIYGCCSA